MAGQIHHDILAADGEAMVDPNWSTPLADLALELASRGGKEMSREDAVRAAQDAESRIGIYDDLPVAAVPRKMIRELRDLLKMRPRNMPKDVAKLSLKEQVAWGKSKPDCRLITPQTANAKGVGSLSAVMKAAIRDDLIELNPCKNQ